MELDVFSTFKYCKISGTVMRRSARRNRRPVHDNTQGIYTIAYRRMFSCRVRHIACIQIDQDTVFFLGLHVWLLCVTVYVCRGYLNTFGNLIDFQLIEQHRFVCI